MFQECKMIAVVQNNASNAEDLMILKHRLNKHGIAVRLFPNQVIANIVPPCCWFGLELTSSPLQVMLSFLKDTVYSNMAPLFIGPNLLIVSKEPKAKELLTSLRASPQITLLGMFRFRICAHVKTRIQLSSWPVALWLFLDISVVYRRLYRQHPAEHSGGAGLRQTTITYGCPRQAGQRADNADLCYSLPAPAAPFPPGCAAAAVRQPGDDLRRAHGGGHVGLQRNSQGLIRSCFGWLWFYWDDEVRASTQSLRLY